MDTILTSDDDWQTLQRFFPANWKELAKSTKAIVRKFRNFSSESDVMRALLMHIAEGYSLRETATRLKLANIAEVSDVALLKRMQCSEVWFKELCLCLFRERGIKGIQEVDKIRLRLVDGTTVKEPGKTGSLWRIHYSIILHNLQCDYFKLTNSEGKGTGESFKQFPVQRGDCIIGDRGYSTFPGIAYLNSQGAYALVRVNTGSVKLLNENGQLFDLINEIKQVKDEYDAKEWNVAVCDSKISIAGRICIIRKSELSIAQAIKRLKRKATLKQKKLKAETEEYAKYIILFTTLPEKRFPLAMVLEWYRYRWQIELVFKRLKSIAGLGHLPKHDEASARAWLYGKLFVGLLVEKLMAYSKVVPP
jgi:hypothetical protein